MSGLDPQAVGRYSRQIALPEVGSLGQARILAARIVLVVDGLVAETAARYLAGAGVGRLTIVDHDTDFGAWPAEADLAIWPASWPS